MLSNTPLILHQALPTARKLPMQILLFSIQAEFTVQLCSEQTLSLPFSQNLPELHIIKPSTSVTHQLKWKSNSQNRVREHSESFYLKECWVCALRTLQAPTASVLLPAMLPAWFLPPALPFTMRQVVLSTLNIQRRPEQLAKHWNSVKLIPCNTGVLQNQDKGQTKILTCNYAIIWRFNDSSVELNDVFVTEHTEYFCLLKTNKQTS